MLKDHYMQLSNIPDPSPSIEKGTIKEKLIEFLEETLYKFQDYCKGKVNVSEFYLNEQLSKVLSYFSKDHPFIFQAETKQKQPKGIDRAVDIGVFRFFSDPNPFFTIEAKILNTSIANNRKTEYVVGSNPKKFTGGIERFKHNAHGVDLEHSAMIGYVQNEDGKYWYTSINNWIQELINGTISSSLEWYSFDLLINICGFKDFRITKYQSESIKTNQTKIILNHYLIDLK